LPGGRLAWYEIILPIDLELEMPVIEKRTVSLPAEHTEFIDAKVASGDYASASEVVRAGLRALKERDDAIERWLREDVASAYDEMKADPSRAIPVEDVFAELRELHARRLEGKL
jgi:antitoxin ParD1/3/4